MAKLSRRELRTLIEEYVPDDRESVPAPRSERRKDNSVYDRLEETEDSAKIFLKKIDSDPTSMGAARAFREKDALGKQLIALGKEFDKLEGDGVITAIPLARALATISNYDEYESYSSDEYQ